MKSPAPLPISLATAERFQDIAEIEAENCREARVEPLRARMLAVHVLDLPQKLRKPRSLLTATLIEHRSLRHA